MQNIEQVYRRNKILSLIQSEIYDTNTKSIKTPSSKVVLYKKYK